MAAMLMLTSVVIARMRVRRTLMSAGTDEVDLQVVTRVLNMGDFLAAVA